MRPSKPRWRPVYVGLGSNLSDPVAQVNRALESLAQLPKSRLVLRSGLYRSAPLGPQDQPEFVNAVAALLSRLDATAFLVQLQRIERAQGRQPDAERWGPRIIDLDLLVFGDAVAVEPGLTLPHPRIAERNFVLLPLGEIAPELVIPGIGRVAGIEVDDTRPRIEPIV